MSRRTHESKPDPNRLRLVSAPHRHRGTFKVGRPTLPALWQRIVFSNLEMSLKRVVFLMSRFALRRRGSGLC